MVPACDQYGFYQNRRMVVVETNNGAQYQVGTPEQKKEIAGLEQKIAAHTKSIAARRAVLAQGQAKWEAEQLKRGSASAWTPLKPIAASAAADFGIAAGSIRAGERQATRSR